MKACIIAILIFLASAGELYAQAYYTQLDNIEPFLSPSMNGLSPNKDLRFSASYRTNNLNTSSPFSTTYLNVDGRAFARYLNETGWIGWGLGGAVDAAGKGDLSTTMLLLNLAYHQMITPSFLLSGGIGVGLNNKTLKQFGSLTFPIQWSGAAFDKSISNNESGLTQSINSLDVRAGINLTYLASYRFVATAGVSIQNINQPVESFYLGGGSTQVVPMKFGAFLQTFNVLGDDVLRVKNSLFYNYQGNVSQLYISTAWDWYFSDYYEDMALVLGMYYRSPATLSPTIGFSYKNFRITLGYDIFLSDYTTADYFYRVAGEVNANYFVKYSNNTFAELITVCPGHF